MTITPMKAEPVSMKLIFVYCISLFVISWGLQISAIATTKGLDDPAMTWWLAANMLTPCIVTFIFMRLYPAMRNRFLCKPNLNLVFATFLAVVIPALLGFSAVLIVEYFSWGKSQWFDFSISRVNILGGPFLLGLGSQGWIVFVFNIFITGLVFALLNAFLAAGEEIAWRGLLQGLLIERVGIWKGILLLGFLWSMWHLPIQLFGYNYPENPIVGSFLISPLILIAYSIFMAWITIYSRSFIPAAIAHGAGNGIQEGIIFHIDLSVPDIYMYLIRVFTAVMIALLFALLLARRNREMIQSEKQVIK
jgi:membrane protease YdiL (CAAX protease family)